MALKTLAPAMKKVLFLASLMLAASAHAQDVVGNAAVGAKLVATCQGCHNMGGGYRSSFPEMFAVPMINGQSAQYIVDALKEYKNGNRRFPTMRAVAASLTDQQMADIAAYYAVPKGQPIK
ncbi:c-type cytochrome [Thiomonas intermedia]|uniref:c-type cytochrome n=1 Tax=Thiomonas intermedia TaxID=926 RepID=UPI001FE6AC6F|nr:c-type cytochrome [Thiomonas intermedia]